MSYILVADVGGTKLATALFNQYQQILIKREVPSDVSTREALFHCLIDSFEMLCMEKKLSFNEVSKVCIGVPGIVDIQKGLAVYQNNIPWSNFPICERLTEFFPHAQIMMDNDVHMATWGEYNARGFRKETMVYITLSTGISCCTIVHGEFLRGTGLAGEIGFNIVGHAGETLEESVAGPALEKLGRTLLGNSNIRLKDMMELYYKGDPIMKKVLQQIIYCMEKQLHQMILMLDPHCIVLGGGFFNHQPKIIELIKDVIQQRLLNTPFEGKEQIIESSIHKGETGLYGAALK
ncbi:ROK family protein [Lysinibacillus fusiformis]|uniref:ROK family protein n=1 Tax=Lysinibacillus fusiformis TaxID=28031 RepID=UPI001881B683|nr:ROK family protein [Lysinibacillus fusiformis]MBD8519719.1 ROK family protein [Lysinibacillus fusiformis]